MMTTFKKTLLVAAVALSASSAFALPVFLPGENTVEFQALENQYRSTAACAAGGCLAADASSPTGFQRVDPTIAGNVAVNDIFAGVVYVTNVLPSFAAVGEFTGYFAQQITSIDVSNPTAAIIRFGTVSADPFGILGAGEMYKLYTDATPDFNPAANITAQQSIANATTATGGVFWASLGLSSEGYAYTIDNLNVSGSNASFLAKSFTALDVINYGASYNAGELLKSNDLSESLFGGVTAGGGTLCSAADEVNGAVTCTDFAGNADVKRNNGTNPWYFRVNDPLVLNVVPEPGSLALVGLALLGLGSTRRRKSAK